MPNDDEATQTGVELEQVEGVVEGAEVEAELEEEVEQPAEEPSDRDLMLANIQKKRIAELVEEGVELDLKPEGEAEVLEDPELEEGELPDLPDGEAGKEVKPEGETEVAIKVDGEEVPGVTEKDIREYQKHLAADKRLEDVNARSKELDLRAQNVANAEAQAARLIEDAKSKQKSNKVAINDDVAKDLSNAILTEDNAAVAKILGQVVQSVQVDTPAQNNQPLDIDKAVATAIQADRYKTQEKEARNKFATEHSDIAGKPLLLKMVNERVAELWQANNEAEPWDLFDRAANDVRDEVGLAKEVKPPTPQHKKTQVPSVPKRASGRVSINRELPPPKTIKQTVASIVADRNARLS